MLKTFRSSRWLNEKGCWVKYDSHLGALLTVPYFAPKLFDNRYSYRFEIMHHLESFYSNITQPNLDLTEKHQLQEVLPAQSHFSHVTRLSLNGWLTNDVYHRIRQQVNCQIIRHLVISSTIDTSEPLTQLMSDLPNLLHLDLRYPYNLKLLSLLRSPLLTIRHLE